MAKTTNLKMKAGASVFDLTDATVAVVVDELAGYTGLFVLEPASLRGMKLVLDGAARVKLYAALGETPALDKVPAKRNGKATAAKEEKAEHGKVEAKVTEAAHHATAKMPKDRCEKLDTYHREHARCTLRAGHDGRHAYEKVEA